MAVRLFNLRDVGEDEAEEVRRLLKQHGFDWYETPAGNWGLSCPSIWLRDASQLSGAQSVLADYQRQRQQRIREHHRQLAEEGRLPGVWQTFIRYPVRFVLFVFWILFFVYLFTVPFLNLL